MCIMLDEGRSSKGNGPYELSAQVFREALKLRRSLVLQGTVPRFHIKTRCFGGGQFILYR